MRALCFGKGRSSKHGSPRSGSGGVGPWTWLWGRSTNPRRSVVRRCNRAAGGFIPEKSATVSAVRLHLVDGTYELYRAHYSKRPERPRKATVGLAASLLALLDDAKEGVSHVAVAFDNPIRSFRNDLFAGYKSDEGVPAELRAQFDDAEEAARALGLVVWSMDRWETDDALATAALRFEPEVLQVRILSPDKDFGQCLRGAKVVLVDRMRDRVLDEDALRALRGVGPESIPDWLALVGDAADGIPGVPGFGEKSAAALLGKFVHVEAIPDDPAAWPRTVRGAARLAASLGRMREEVALYKQLATLVTDVPIRETLDELRHHGVPREAFPAWCKKLDAEALATRPRRFA